MRYAHKRLLVALVAGLLASTNVLAQAPATYRTLDVGDGGRAVESSGPLPACFIINDALIAGTYCVAGDGTSRTPNWTSYAVEPSLPQTGLFTVQVTSALPDLIFAEDFEGGDESLWPGGRWGRVVGHRRSPYMIRGGYWYPVGHLHSAAGNDYLVSTVMGDSVSTDTPATTPYRPYLQAGEVVSWTAYDTSQGWLDVGGVAKHRELVFTASNHEDPYTHVKPLDGLHGEVFAGEEFILYAVDPVNRPGGVGLDCGEIADGQILFRGTVIDSSFSGGVDDQFTWTVREQTAEGLKVPTTPFILTGAGTGVLVESGGSFGSGARITRADTTSLRGTGSQWFAWAVGSIQRNDDLASEYTIFDSPIARLRRVPSGGIGDGYIKAQLLDNSSVWTTVGTQSAFPASELKTVLVNYNLTGTSATVYYNGVDGGSATISGGIKASAAAGAAEWYSNPSSGTSGIAHYWFRHGTRLLAASEIEDRGLYTFDISQESNLDAAIEFLEGTGTIISDSAVLANGTGTPAVITSFADANGSWKESDLGNASQARTRPRATVGRPFSAQLESVGIAHGHYSPGFTASAKKTIQRVVADGSRLAAVNIGGGAGSNVFRTTGNEIDGLPMPAEPAVGQVLTWTGTSDATNDGNYTVEKLLIDPRTFNGLSATITIAVTESFTAKTIAGTWSTSTTGVWRNGSQSLASELSVIEIDSGATDNMSAAILGLTTGNSRPLVSAALAELGPETAPTETNLASVNRDDFGWQGEGAVDALESFHVLAKRTPSADYAPSVVYRNSAGAWQVRGMDTAPSSANFTWDERRIASATEKALPTTYDKVRVQYAKSWAAVPAGLVSSVTKDSLPQEVAIPYREVTSGTGSKELVVEAYFLYRDDAQQFADTLLSIVTTGRLYTLQVYGPISKTEAAAVPFDAIDVTWSADSFLSAGRKGTLVGWSVDSNNNSATATVLFIP